LRIIVVIKAKEVQSSSRESTQESAGFLRVATFQVPTERQVPMSPAATIAGSRQSRLRHPARWERLLPTACFSIQFQTGHGDRISVLGTAKCAECGGGFVMFWRDRLACFNARSLQLGQSVAAAGAPRQFENWSLTSLQQRLVKTGGRLVKHAR
jgi:hypothetical protein